MFCALWHPAGATCPWLCWRRCSTGMPLPGTGTALLVAVPRAWHHLQSCCHHPVSPARSWCCSWLVRRHSRTKVASDASDEGKWRLQFCGPVSAPVRMLTRILNNNPGARSLENVKPHALVVLDTPATGWLMASPGGWAVWGQHSDSLHRDQQKP